MPTLVLRTQVVYTSTGLSKDGVANLLTCVLLRVLVLAQLVVPFVVSHGVPHLRRSLLILC